MADCSPRSASFCRATPSPSAHFEEPTWSAAVSIHSHPNTLPISVLLNSAPFCGTRVETMHARGRARAPVCARA